MFIRPRPVQRSRASSHDHVELVPNMLICERNHFRLDQSSGLQPQCFQFQGLLPNLLTFPIDENDGR